MNTWKNIESLWQTVNKLCSLLVIFKSMNEIVVFSPCFRQSCYLFIYFQSTTVVWSMNPFCWTLPFFYLSPYGVMAMLAMERISFLWSLLWNHFEWCYLERIFHLTKSSEFTKTTGKYPKSIPSLVLFNRLLRLQDRQK